MLSRIFNVDWEIDEQGNLQIEQGADMGNDGDVSRVELHPMHVRFFAEQMGMLGAASAAMPEALITRLCMTRDRMSQLQDQLLADDRQSQPFQVSEPWMLGGIVLDDLDQLLNELGVPRGESTAEPRTSVPVLPATSASSPEQPEAPASTTGSLL